MPPLSTKALLQTAAFHREHPHAHMEYLVQPRTLPKDDSGNFLPAPFSERVAPLGPTASLGTLGSLPLELLLVVTDLLDIKSYLALRQVSCGTRYVLSDVAAYRDVVKYAKCGLAAIIHSGMWQHATFVDLYAATRRSDCDICGAPGLFLYMPTMKRCCRPCLTLHDSLRTVTLPSFIRHTDGVTPATVRRSTLPVLGGGGIGRPIKLVNFLQASALLGTDATTPERLGRGYKSLNTWYTGRNAVATPMPFWDGELNSGYKPYCCKGCTRRFEWLDKQPRPLMYDDAYWREWKQAHTLYTKVTFIEHFFECTEAQSLWQLKLEIGELRLVMGHGGLGAV